MLDGVKYFLDHGYTVIVHCRAGRHRAALALCIFLICMLGIKFNEARAILEKARSVDLDGILERTLVKGRWTEAHKLYIPGLERKALEDDCPYRALPEEDSPRKAQLAPVPGPASSGDSHWALASASTGAGS